MSVWSDFWTGIYSQADARPTLVGGNMEIKIRNESAEDIEPVAAFQKPW